MDWTDSHDRLNQILNTLTDISQEAENGATIIVEGQRDEEALRELGIDGTYFRASQSGKSLADIAGDVYRQGTGAIMALDWDSHGARLEIRLHELLQRFGVPVDRETRIRLGALVKKDIVDVESLPSLISNLRRETGTGPWPDAEQNRSGGMAEKVHDTEN